MLEAPLPDTREYVEGLAVPDGRRDRRDLPRG